MAQTLLHACYRVYDLEASIKFYTEVFDFTVSRERRFPEHGFDIIYLVVPGSDFELELTYNYDSDRYEIGNGFSHLAIGVDDLQAIHAKCKESGYETTELKGLPGSEPSYFFVTDPDGYRLEVMRNK
ncbi:MULTISPECIES: lactoylglutathione lyase [Globicatella]|uniref:Aldoketomutase n=2 Tax=Globicatella sulfidifaciens TaxID=136093 RepID=A0A1T4N998_9LACT|nr:MULTISPECIES: VOC family protein [Globicatella]MDK7631186.1 VOC family protein [Globicatella sanguinis]MDT2768616.1 VOC family protein [Globicatella sulfidifaciens]NLJ19172.1 lactoylglutathione lyase [Globicatella sulfidifaciens]WIK66898.1 VOC family protein [Globicatella sanguinis]WKT56303.1 VOC family protein [Globicatella sanguinis]